MDLAMLLDQTQCCSTVPFSHTVDGRNAAPVDMVNIPSFTGFYTSQVVVWDFSHQQWGVSTRFHSVQSVRSQGKSTHKKATKSSRFSDRWQPWLPTCNGTGLQQKSVLMKNLETLKITGWPLVGNEGINLYIGILGIHSLIPY